MGFFRYILSKVSGRVPPVNTMDPNTLAWNQRDGILYGCKEAANGTREVVAIGGNQTVEPVDLTHYCYIAWRDAPGDGFTLNPNNNLSYEAILYTHTPIEDPVEADFDGLWRFRAEYSLKTDDISFEYRDLADGNLVYILDVKACFEYHIQTGVFVVDSGTLAGIIVKINGVAVTGLNGVEADNTIQEFTAKAYNVVGAGDLVTLHITGAKATGTTTLVGKLKILRG